MELPELAPKQAEAIKTLCEMDREARRTNADPNARTAFLAVALLLAKRGVLDYLVAGLLKQAEGLQIPARVSLFKDLAFDIEHAMREEKPNGPNA